MSLFLVLSFAFSALLSSLAQQTGEGPLQLVRPNADHSGFELVPETVSKLTSSASEKRRIAVISVVGPYHSGKSFLLNALIGKTDVFPVGPKTSPETLGLWLCRSNLKLPSHKDVEVWFVDSEGFFGPQVEDSYDAKTFTLAMMLGDEFVYNTVKIIDAQAVNMLEMLARRAQLFRVKSMAASGGVAQKLETVPHLTWVVEDFVQSVDEADGNANTRWLETYLYKSSSSDVPYLKKLFPSLSVKALFLPATTRAALADLSKVPFSQLTPEFVKDLNHLRSSILQRLDEKKSFSKVSEFVQTLYFLTKALDKGTFPQLPSLWQSWRSEVVASSFQDAFNAFEVEMLKLVAEKNKTVVVSSSEFNSISGHARTASLNLYAALAQDFLNGNEKEVQLESILAELDAKLKETHHQTFLQFMEKVKEFIEERRKYFFSSFLTLIPSVVEKELLLEPAVLQARLAELALRTVAEFGLVVDRFDTKKESNELLLPKNWDKAAFPVFQTDPIDSLRIELQNQIDSIILENMKSIANLIKASAITAVASVDELLASVSGTLFSTTELSNFVKKVIERALAVYDSELGRAWIKSIAPQYEDGVKQIRSLVKSKTQKFEYAHQDLLFEWFRKTSEKALTVYRDLKRTIETSRLPCEEEDMERAHSKAVTALIHAMDVELGASKFNDTKPYLETRSRMEALVETELVKLRKKNVELWKVHSDEATLCASELNLRYTESFCPQGWFCWFKLWPGAFKARSKEHLMTCLGSSNLSLNMKDLVFESYFEKELSKDVSEVRNNMWMALVSLLVPVAWIVYIKRC